ncbi:hypothetical protein [Pseudomonas fluorescens]|uniref:hypothetical protein n=1 Tax=Pseudomonas fluorescens TaxID=294 RepID=UPI001241E0F8|nr:hypothetical protein [Pseudomonas fluorescens]
MDKSKSRQKTGASVASVAMSHGINANVVRKWLPRYWDQQLTNLPAFDTLILEPQIQAGPQNPSASSFRAGEKR